MFLLFPVTPLLKGDFLAGGRNKDVLRHALTFQEDPEKNANKSWFPGSTQGRICCLMAEKEGNSNKDIVKRNIWSLAMCFICSTYNLYFTKRIKKYLKGQCPNRRLSCIGKYARNAISYKVSMDELRLSLFVIFFLDCFKVHEYMCSLKQDMP